MKISKGTILEFTIAVLIIFACLLDIRNYWFTIPFGIASIITIIDCLIKWFKMRREKNNIVEEDICIYKTKLRKISFVYLLTIFSLLLNVFYIFVLNKNKEKIKEEIDCYKLDFISLEKQCSNFSDVEFEVDIDGKIMKTNCNSIQFEKLKKYYSKQIKKCE